MHNKNSYRSYFEYNCLSLRKIDLEISFKFRDCFLKGNVSTKMVDELLQTGVV